jgi:hypothetical protein
MFRRAALCLAVCAAAPLAEAAEKGQIGLSLKTSSPLGSSHTGPVLSFQLSPRLALRPHFGLGFGRGSRYDAESGRFEDAGRRYLLDLGGTGVLTLRPGKAWSPYVGLGLTYSYADPPTLFAAGDPRRGETLLGTAPPAPVTRRNFVTASGLAGVQYTINRRFTVFGEIGAAATPGDRYDWDGSRWQKASAFDAQRPFRSGVGLTVNLR